MQNILLSKGTLSTGVFAFLVKNNSALMGLRNYTKDTWKDVSVWTSPGGRSDDTQTIEETLRREVYEETGIAEFEIVDYIGKADGAQGDDKVHFFYCVTDKEPKLMEPDKFSEWKWVPMKEYLEDDAYGGFNPRTRKAIVKFLHEK